MQTFSALQTLKQEAALNRSALIAGNGPMTVHEPDSLNQLPVAAGAGAATPPPMDFDKMVSPESFGAQYYQFTIESFGWFNIDMLLKDVPGVEPSELWVRIQGSYHDRINIYLIIPSLKVNVEGGPSGNKNEYAFYKKDGKIPLPQGAKAYILAVRESDETIAYDLRDFTIGKKQQITSELHKAGKEEFTRTLSVFDEQGLHIKVRETKNVSAIRAQDMNLKVIEQQLKDAERLKPKGCGCTCMWESMATE
jgi:hypothetical protein